MDEFFNKGQGFAMALTTLIIETLEAKSTGITAIADALSFLGKPSGIIGGIIYLVGEATVVFLILKYLTYAIVYTVVIILKKRGRTDIQVMKTLRGFPLLSWMLLTKIEIYLDKKQTTN